jgi:hypothetical protein
LWIFFDLIFLFQRHWARHQQTNTKRHIESCHGSECGV